MTHTPHPAPGADADGRTQNTRSEVQELRSILNAIFYIATTQAFRADQIITLEQNAAELNRRLDVIIEMTREYRTQPPTPASEEA